MGKLVKVFLVVIAGVILFVLISNLVIFFHPYNGQVKSIKKSILKKTPIGITKEELFETIQEKGWEKDQNHKWLFDEEDITPNSIFASLGYYRSSVKYTHWKFDENDKLVEVQVNYYTDPTEHPFWEFV